MTANIINMLTVMLGSIIGILFKKGIPNRLNNAIMTAIGICTVYIGYTGAICDVNVIIIIASMILGAIAGTLIDIDGKINILGEKIKKRFKAKDTENSFTDGFVTSCLLFCVGSMTITGALQAGLTGDTKLIVTKSVLDLMSSAMLASSFGTGVFFASFFVLIFQGSITLFAEFLSPFLNPGAIASMTSVGSLITIMLGLNLMNISKIKVANYLLAIAFAPVICNIVPYIERLLNMI